jgi:DNA sulfur modification protein DndE
MKKKTEPKLKKVTSGESCSPVGLGIERVPFTATLDNRMRSLKARTGVTPNILARLGFCLSLEEPGVPDDPFRDEEVGREINRNTLLGSYDFVYVALLRTWALEKAPGVAASQEQFDNMFIAHMNRGFELISGRIKSLGDLERILPRNI